MDGGLERRRCGRLGTPIATHGGGALLEIGTHQSDLWRWLLESEVESVDTAARSTAFDDQTATFQVRMTNGVLVSAAVSQRSVSHNVIEIFGSRGSLRLSCYHADSLEVTGVGGATSGVWRRLRPVIAKAAQIPAVLRAARGGGDFQMSYVHEWERIRDALASGDAMPATVHDGRRRRRSSSPRSGRRMSDGPSLRSRRRSVLLDARTA